VRVGVVVPVKAFSRAKQRLAPALTERARADLARWCATRVVAASAPFAVHVVCDDPDVRTWAEGEGTRVIWCPGTGLNLAVRTSLDTLATEDYSVIMVVHGDLPLARRLDHVVTEGAVCLVPDHRGDGTNVLAVPGTIARSFAPQYGRGSFRRHVREALGLGASVRVLRDANLGRDLDTPADLADPHLEEVRQWLRTSPASPH
jgi:2-phospho-L-lactate/phosphoenolpyruvate guanylyltransferase